MGLIAVIVRALVMNPRELLSVDVSPSNNRQYFWAVLSRKVLLRHLRSGLTQKATLASHEI